MDESILGIVEESLLNIAKRYKEFSSNPDVIEADLKGFDEQLNDIMDRYNKLKGLQSTYTAEELTIKLNEFQVLYDDLVLKIGNGFFKGADGINGVDGQNGTNGLDGKDFTYNDFTPEQLASLKGADGINGADGQNGSNGLDGKDFTYNDFTPEQLALLKGADGINGADGQNGLDGTNGLDGKDFTYNDFTPEQLALLKGADGINGVDGQNGSNGLDGKDFTYNDFTPEQLALLKGADGINGADGQNGLDGTVTFESLTPEQKASLKGADGINGVDGLNGTNGIDGLSFTYDMFTPEQIASLKGAKGAKGDNGLDGQNLTYADLTVEQKQEFANLVPSGGSSDLSLNVVSARGSLATESLHVKTGLKADSIGVISANGYMFYSATAKYVLSNTCIYQTVLKPDGSIIVGTVLSTTHFSGSYISSDGYLCIICKSSNYSILYDLDIFDYTNNKKCSVLGSFVTADALYYQTH